MLQSMSFENVIAEVELAYGEQQFAEDTGWNNSSLPFLGLLHSRFLLLSKVQTIKSEGKCNFNLLPFPFPSTLFRHISKLCISERETS